MLTPIIGNLVFKQLYGRRLFRTFFREEVAGPHAAPSLERIDWHYDRFNSPPARESASAVMRAVLDARPIAARLSRITTCRPSLSGGAMIGFYPATSAQRLAREIIGAKLELMDSGHAPHEERPAAFVELVSQFLEGRR